MPQNEDNPQLEDGYTRVANELLEAIIAFPFTNRQLKMVLALIRLTYGYNQKVARVSKSYLARITGLHLPHVGQTLRELERMNVLITRDGKMGINKRYGTWVPVRSRTARSDQAPSPREVIREIRQRLRWQQPAPRAPSPAP
ncbi:MAG: hypothetical protein DRP95_05520 [Candidatus Latescibacterota bacterium]|nr:MAG: hypothetical protein DRP95_05520 [Candidatus Latescibacterota bacterium]